ncbi:MAG: hypothetical protein HFG20_05735 [Anaerotruncus sp.]|jgi:hypothetical protein|nr:hypothetical protein [Anaerotruncus sp.]
MATEYDLGSVRGPQGETGKSAYQAAQQAGFTGTEQEFNQQLKAVAEAELVTQQQFSDALGGKIDTVPAAVQGNIPVFTADGRVADSGKNAASIGEGNVKSVNDRAPDEAGNVQLPEICVGPDKPDDPNVLLWYDTNGEIAPPAEQPPAAGNIAVFDANGRVVDGQTPIRDWATREQVSNANLLINWYFADPINQRGQTEYADAGYTIDRWYLQNITFAKLSLTNEGISLSIQNNDGIVQNIKKEYLQSGEVYTSSILTADGELLFCTFTLTDTITKYRYNNSNFWCAAGLGGSKVFWKFWSVITYDNPNPITTTIVAAKLELGDHQTLAHQDVNGSWVLNDPPPDRALELAKCQRYYMVLEPAGHCTLGVGLAIASTALQIYVPLPTSLRIAPTLIYNGGVYLVDGVSAAIELSTASVLGLCTNLITLDGTVASTVSLTPKQIYSVRRSDAGSKGFILDAEIY